MRLMATCIIRCMLVSGATTKPDESIAGQYTDMESAKEALEKYLSTNEDDYMYVFLPVLSRA